MQSRSNASQEFIIKLYRIASRSVWKSLDLKVLFLDVNTKLTFFNIKIDSINLNDEDIEALITGIYYYTIPEGSKSITQVVHFQDNAAVNDIYQKKCGICHKALTSAGALGTSEDAPNLSGLSKVYPDYLNGRHWNKELLDKWLINPRSLKKNAVMPIIELTDKEKKAVIDILIE